MHNFTFDIGIGVKQTIHLKLTLKFRCYLASSLYSLHAVCLNRIITESSSIKECELAFILLQG